MSSNSAVKEWREKVGNSWYEVEECIALNDYSTAIRKATLPLEGLLKNMLLDYLNLFPPEIGKKYFEEISEKTTMGILTGFWMRNKILSIIADKKNKRIEMINGINIGYINELRNGVSHDPPLEVRYEQANYVAKSVEILFDFFEIKYVSKLKKIEMELAVFPINTKSNQNISRVKAIYYKVMVLSEQIEGVNPKYIKYCDRIEKKVDVYDEILCFEFSQFNDLQNVIECDIRTSGIADMFTLSPFVKEILFDDRGARYIDGIIHQTIKNKPHIASLKVSSIFNGLQKNNTDMALKVGEKVDQVVMVVDFSSITNIGEIMKSNPVAVIRKDGIDIKSLPVGIINNQKYFIEVENLEDSVLRMDFDFGW